MLSLLHGLSRERVAVAKIWNGGHPLHSLYDGVSGRTLSRDIEFLRKTGLLDLEDGFVRARVEAVDHYRP